MKFENKCKKLGITEEVENLLANCELYDEENDPLNIVELSKIRKWEIIEVIGNYLDPKCDIFGEWDEIKQLKSFCKAVGIKESEVAEYYAHAICDEGYQIAYALESNKDAILIIGE